MNGRFSGWIIFISEIEIRELFVDRQEQKGGGEEPRSFIAGPAKVMCGLRGNRTRKQSRKEAPIENVRWLLGRIPLQTGRPFSIPSQSSIATRPFPLSSSPLAHVWEWIDLTFLVESSFDFLTSQVELSKRTDCSTQSTQVGICLRKRHKFPQYTF